MVLLSWLSLRPDLPALPRKIENDDAEVKRTVNVNFVDAAAGDTDSVNKLIHDYAQWHCFKKAVAWMMKLKQLLLTNVSVFSKP